jgi:hypothetical protein
MTAASTHAKDPAEGWDLFATGKADKGEKIARVQILVNGSGECDQTFDPPMDNWQENLTQQGQYPGSNVVQVTIASVKSDTTESYDSWS